MKVLLCSLLSLFLATASHGVVVFFNASLDGSQEVGPVVTSGSGSATVSLETTTGDWTLTGSFINLTGNSTASHIHGPAAPGANAGVTAGGALTITTVGSTFGSLSGAGTFTPTQVADLNSGLFYVNVHSSFAPGGEVRGQLIPEPGTATLLGLVGIGLLRRRRSR